MKESVLSFVGFIENIGENVINYSIRTYDFLRFLFKFIGQIFSIKSYSKKSREFLIEEIYLSSIRYLFSFIFSALFLGSIFIVIAISFAINFNLIDQIGEILVLFVFNEFSPFFTTLFFIFAYCLSSQEKIQNMNKDKENIINEIYVPKIISVLFMTPLMALFFAIIMIASGYVVSYFYLNLDLVTYKDLIISSISFENIIILLLKAIFFGFISIFIPVFIGHKKEKDSLNITGTVIRSLIIILTILLLSEFLFMLIFYNNF